MKTLHWIFNNGHAWFKTCGTIEEAENHAEICGLYKNRAVDRVYIETENGDIWLKEKAAQ